MALQKKIGLVFVALVLLSACGTSAAPDVEAGKTGAADENSELNRNELQIDFADNALSPALQLVVGTLMLEDSDLAVDSEQAAILIPYWKLYIKLSESDTAAPEEKDALIDEIQLLMTPDQVNEIAGLELTQGDMLNLIDELGISENMRPDGSGASDGSGRPEGLPEGVRPGGGQGSGPGGGQGTEGLDPELVATMQARREEEGGGGFFGTNRLVVPLIEQLITLFEEKSAN